MDFISLENVLQRRKAAMDSYYQLQLKLLENLQGKNPGMAAQLEKEMSVVNGEIASQTTDLAPLMSAWRKLPQNEKAPYLRGKIGEILNQIEKIAEKIELNFKKQQEGSNINGKGSPADGNRTQSSIYLAN